MRFRSLSILLAILLVTSLTVPLAFAGKPVIPNPEYPWPSGTRWGTKLLLENGLWACEAWFGAGSTPEKYPTPPPWIGYVIIEFVEGEFTYSEIVWPLDTPPQKYSWYFRMYSGGAAPAAATLSWVRENATHSFFPENDFSLVIENATAGIGPINLRKVDNKWFDISTTVYATLYVDNAVNIISIENLDPLVGTYGDPVRLRVTVRNTGRYTDNYRVWCDGGVLDPENWTGGLLPDAQTSVILTTTLPLDTGNIVITAEGWYAKDVDYVTATGLRVGRVEVNISPEENTGENGETVTFDVCVMNTGAILDNYKLTVDSVWSAWLSENQLKDLDRGENEHITLFVKIPDNARPGDSATITVTATSENNENVRDNATCIARMGFYGVRVSILENYKENTPGGKLNYTIKVSNTGTIGDSYRLTFRDNINGDTYWEDNISLDNSLLAVPAGENRTTMLRITIPDNAPPGTNATITVTATSQADNTLENSASCIAHVKIVRVVEVSISPPENSAGPCNWLEYTVTVRNTGNVADTYDLTKDDELGWDNIRLDNDALWVDKGNENMTKLRVHIPWCAEGDTINRITVTATSRSDGTVSAFDTCEARVAVVRGVEVQIIPKVRENVRRENATFTVKVLNKGNVEDSFNLSLSDTRNWGGNISPLENVLWAPKCGENTTTLRVRIPENAIPGTEDNITVTATSRTVSTVKDNDSCTVRVTYSRGVGVSISPSENSAIPGENVTFTITVTNTGDNADNYVLQAKDNMGWRLSLADNLMENVAPGGKRTTKLTVSIPENAAPGTRDNITVTATSGEDENITGSATCIARSIAIIRGVEVSISPNLKEGMQGGELSFTVGVKNIGNITDCYDLTTLDNLGWNPSLAENSFENVAPGENRTTTLTVSIPDNADPGTEDNITVTATSRENASVSRSATCLARALILRRVEITISPGYRNGPPGATLIYTVKVTNAGRASDNFKLVASGAGGWVASIDPDSLALEPGESGEATLSVTVPPGAGGSSMTFFVWAISSEDPEVRTYTTCRALALEIGEGVGLEIPWIQILIIAALIVGAVFAVGYLTRRRGMGKRRSILRM